MRISAIAKAIVAALAAGASAAAVAVQDGTVGRGDVLTVALAVLGALGATYAVPNRTDPAAGAGE